MEKSPLDQKETVGKITEIQLPTTSFDRVREVTKYHIKNLHQCQKYQPSCSIIISTQSQN